MHYLVNLVKSSRRRKKSDKQQCLRSLQKLYVASSFEMVVKDTPVILPNTRSRSVHRFSFTGSMATWLHCNGCYIQLEPGVERRFYITSCSHIYCEECVDHCTKEGCKLCKSKCSTLMLGGKIPREVESLFGEPSDLFQKFIKQFYQSYHKTLDFQKSHQRRLLRHLKEKVKAIDSKMDEVKNVISQAQAIKRENMKLKEQNNYLKLLLSKRDSHPRSGFRTHISPGSYSVSPTLSPACGKGLNYTTLQQRGHCGGSSNILNQPGRLLVRTPPSDGHLGTVGGMACTPTDPGSLHSSVTPLSVPRPISLHHNE